MARPNATKFGPPRRFIRAIAAPSRPGLGVLVADDRDGLPAALEEAQAAQHPVDGRGRQADEGGDPVGSPAAADPQARDVRLLGGREPPRGGVRPGAPVDETGLPGSPPGRQPLDDPAGDVMTGLVASTEHLTVGRSYLPPGRRSGIAHYDGDTVVVLLSGRLNVYFPDAERDDIADWCELEEGDALYAPGGTRHQLVASHAGEVEILIGTAPTTFAEPRDRVSRG